MVRHQLDPNSVLPATMQKSCCAEGFLGGSNNALDMHKTVRAILLGVVDRGIFSQLHVGEETSIALATVADSLDSKSPQIHLSVDSC